MDDEELDCLNDEGFNCSNMFETEGCSISMDSIFDSLEDNHACIHTHTCNTPGAGLPHIHTCSHVHTKVLSGPSNGETANCGEKKSNKGNKEATRRYRQKKKDQYYSMDTKVKSLEAEIQQLRKRLEGQAALEAENARLKYLLVDLKGRIEGEIGSFSCQKPAAYPCNLQGNNVQFYCPHPGGVGAFNGCCELEQCLANQDSGFNGTSTDLSAPPN